MSRVSCVTMIGQSDGEWHMLLLCNMCAGEVIIPCVCLCVIYLLIGIIYVMLWCVTCSSGCMNKMRLRQNISFLRFLMLLSYTTPQCSQVTNLLMCPHLLFPILTAISRQQHALHVNTQRFVQLCSLWNSASCFRG
ncbi:hypothetical protein, unlikely [Trypanosoma brucei gambiense DAL972]|uniref:Uncharacterized protein n=1 Tax=Trypanosoma brucei gambiense (strain MHOM/CI/86/DAL972) TaxID=679716 RepID=D0A2S4_TRYB9|nr:hypothetical protein, unlikely [Trypanosoma brucei gambiense DAL972]CBH15568.1 hypothetical protein, unlikely [Trypanosoma brucei gambiense DAL972]|eukprot:XP_011777832.1 hypothetical protein, unlikely [Trypanosoma brucei gambiense DAL972]